MPVKAIGIVQEFDKERGFGLINIVHDGRIEKKLTRYEKYHRDIHLKWRNDETRTNYYLYPMQRVAFVFDPTKKKAKRLVVLGDEEIPAAELLD